MTNFPTFSSGFGGLSQEVLNEWSRLLMLVNEVKDDLPHIARLAAQAEISEVFPALLVGYQDPLGLNRFQYAWIEAQWSSGYPFLQELEGGRNSYDDDWLAEDPSVGTPFTRPAYNTIENGNSGFSIESSVNIEGDAYPTTWYLQPIRGGGDTPVTYEPEATQFWPVARSPGVIMHLFRDDLGDVVPLFSTMNVHDGECT